MDLGGYLATSNITEAILLQTPPICSEQSSKQWSNGPGPSYGGLLGVGTPKRLHINHGTASWTGIVRLVTLFLVPSSFSNHQQS
jgi:hypothetical protein